MYILHLALIINCSDELAVNIFFPQTETFIKTQVLRHSGLGIEDVLLLQSLPNFEINFQYERDLRNL